MIIHKWNLNVDKNTDNNFCGMHKYNIKNLILGVNVQ